MNNNMHLFRFLTLIAFWVVFTGVANTQVTFYLDTLTITQNPTDDERYTVPLRVLNFEAVSGFQIEITLEDAALSFEGNGIASSVFSPPGQNSGINGSTLSVIYIDLSGAGATLDDDAFLLELDLRIIGEPGDCFPISVEVVEVTGEDPTVPILSVGFGGDVCLRGFVEISGQVTAPSGEVLDSVAIALVTVDSTYTDTTNLNGNYTFTGVPAGEPFTIRPLQRLSVETRSERIAGINVGDVVVGQSALIVGPTLSAAQLLAADTNADESFSLLDLTTLAAYILLRIDEISGNAIYFYWAADYDFSDPANPWSEPIPLDIMSDGELEDADGFNFFAVKRGDINGSSY